MIGNMASGMERLIIEHEHFLSEVLLHAVASSKSGDMKESIHAASLKSV
jgi:hypothetical protein